jgi:hypothetical protein
MAALFALNGYFAVTKISRQNRKKTRRAPSAAGFLAGPDLKASRAVFTEG